MSHSDRHRTRIEPHNRWWLLSLPLLLFLGLPLAALVLRSSPGQVWRNVQDPAVYEAIVVSLRTSVAATGVTVLLGTPAAYLMARRSFRGKRAPDTLLHLPTVLPPAVAGVALLIAFGRRGRFARWGRLETAARRSGGALLRWRRT